MTKAKTPRHPVLIIGAGRGGTALLEMFLEDDLVNVLGIADKNADAPGLRLARDRGVSAFTDVADAVATCKPHPDCIIYNLTHDETVSEVVRSILGEKQLASGPEVELFWRMVTELKRTQNELKSSQLQLQAIIHSVMDGIVTVNESGQIMGFNPAAEKIFGYRQQELLGSPMEQLVAETVRQRFATCLSRFAGRRNRRSLSLQRREVTALRKDGEHFSMELSASEMVLTNQRFFIGIIRDITERKQAEEKIAHLAHHDYLTGLPNRALFLDRLQRAISLARRGQYRAAVLYLDLDGFKQINDTLGHAAGDRLLQEVAQRLKDSVRSSDTVARVGGDEFTFVLNNVGERENVSITAERVIKALSRPVDLCGTSCQVGASLGISLFPDDSEEAESLLHEADEAMYAVKQNGKNAFRFYQD
jgi:diguanylate cyclase (GGDEF)-like protein/PAS domain S-box-containing protein